MENNWRVIKLIHTIQTIDQSLLKAVDIAIQKQICTKGGLSCCVKIRKTDDNWCHCQYSSKNLNNRSVLPD